MCCWSCLGPLSFHSQAVGDMVRLSRGGLQAERRANTFKNGLVFSSRPLKVQERIRLRVEKDSLNWNGGLRLGFTTVHPMARSLPLPIMAIPNLTETPGHWAAPVHESFCQAGVELEFWVSARGSMYISGNNGREQKLLSGVDRSRPLWAMIDIYGQTCSISLLGMFTIITTCSLCSLFVFFLLIYSSHIQNNSFIVRTYCNTSTSCCRLREKRVFSHQTLLSCTCMPHFT